MVNGVSQMEAHMMTRADYDVCVSGLHHEILHLCASSRDVACYSLVLILAGKLNLGATDEADAIMMCCEGMCVRCVPVSRKE
jgi:hypothetical protein